MIHPHCRYQFTLKDLEFITSVLEEDKNKQEKLRQLLTDRESLDIILDDKKLIQKVLENPNHLSISLRLYFYLLVRHTLMRIKMDDRLLSDYIAELLTSYTRSNLSRHMIPNYSKTRQHIFYYSDLLASLESASGKMRFSLLLFLGNYTLFLTGIFPHYLHHRNKRKAAPNITFYEKIGSESYKKASEDRLAKQYDLKNVLLQLSATFHHVRLALNTLSDRSIFLGLPSCS